MSREDYYRRYNESDEHVELIEGRVYRMTPAGPRHVTAVNRLRRAIEKQIDEDRFVLRQESQIVLTGDSDPEPDLCVVRGPESRYDARHPNAADVLLVIEVSDSSLSRDQNIKLPLYAEQAIPEVWIVNLLVRQVEIYRRPDPLVRRYQDQVEVTSGPLPSPLNVPSVSIIVDPILPRL